MTGCKGDGIMTEPEINCWWVRNLLLFGCCSSLDAELLVERQFNGSCRRLGKLEVAVGKVSAGDPLSLNPYQHNSGG